jgi:hypothetical protein
MYTDEHEPLPHPEPGPGEPTHKYAGDLPKLDAPSIQPSQAESVQQDLIHKYLTIKPKKPDTR